MRLTKTTPQEIIAQVDMAHSSDITAILALTDNYSMIQFVTVSLDEQIKIFAIDGELEYETQADG